MREGIERYIKMWEDRCYDEGIPDEVPPRLSQLKKAPSYKQICSAIFKNDHCLKTLGLTPPKSEAYSELKRIEIEARNKPKKK
jgi:predicted phosphoadenosine phosphosulfate sulfurtransferase